MQIVRDPTSAANVADPEIRNLIQRLFTEICDDGEPYDFDRHGYTVLVEAGDSPEALEEETGCYIVRDARNGTRFGDPDFAPSFEFVEEYSNTYHMDFVLNDEGFGVSVIVPKTADIDRELLQLCAHYAEPVSEEVMTQPE